MKVIRIGGGAGYGGDRIEPALDLIEHGSLDYIIFECLAERTIALAQQQKLKNENKGYNDLLEYRMSKVLPRLKEHPVKIITNMGAANPISALHLIEDMAEENGLGDLKVAAVVGDSVTEEIENYLDLPVLETGSPLSAIADKIVSANAYIGAKGIVEALQKGADIIVTGRVADPVLTLGPLVYEFGWRMDDYVRLGRGTVAGHLLECGAQVCGGYFADPPYKEVERLWDVGFPIAEISEEGLFTITKLPQAGGQVTAETVSEQLIYEIHDPEKYFTPDVTADFSKISLESGEKDHITVRGVSGRPGNGLYKVSVGYKDGFIGEGEISYGGEGCYERARMASDIIRHRLKPYEDDIQEIRFDIIGADSLYGSCHVANVQQLRECRLRIAVRTEDRLMAKVVGDEVEALYTNGPAGGGGARKNIKEVMSIASIFIPQDDITISVVEGRLKN